MGSPKFDLVNEQQLLASAAREEDSRKRILGVLSDDGWQSPIHRTIFQALRRCQERGLAPTPGNLSVCAEGDDFGGEEYLVRVCSIEPSGDLDFHLDRFERDFARAKAIEQVEAAKGILQDRTREFGDAIRAVSAPLETLRGVTGAKRGAAVERKWQEEMDRRFAGAIPFVSTGYMPLDSVLAEGLSPGKITVIGGRTRMGKSATVKDLVRRVLAGKKKKRILFVPLEGGPDQVIDSLVSGITGIPQLTLLKEPQSLTPEQREEIRAARESIFSDDRLHIEDDFYGIGGGTMFGKGGWSNERALQRVEELLAGGEYDIVVWDLFQRMLMNAEPQRITQALVFMQALAARYKSHQIIVQQLSRKVEDEKRKNHRPNLSDLKDSGGYEEAADLVLLLHREKVYKPIVRRDTIEINVAKQKRGGDGWTMLADFCPEVCRLENERMQLEEERGRSGSARFMKEEEDVL